VEFLNFDTVILV